MKFHREILIASTLLGSWLGMQAVHELGHVCGAWLTGGKVKQVVLHPLTISRTDLAENPAPLTVVWAGPLIGVLLPLLLWLAATIAKMPGNFVLRFFAGFCLIANGLYISLGSFGRIGDCGEMLRHGSAIWLLWLFGLVTVPAGVWLWHGQGAEFGLGKSPKVVSPKVAYSTGAICLAILAAELVFGGE
ncbi:MAG: M50 family metallopeptidase [Planctomycetales bacterium]|nr:M50 family metallopeptidase [Planctomycetales bacterium]